MHPFELNIKHTIVDRELLTPGDRVLAGVSGGPDSMALLHVFAELRRPLQFSFIAAYIDHGLRPDEVVEEIGMLQDVCINLDVLFHVIRVDCIRHAKEQKRSLEHAARELRYRAFDYLVRKHALSLIAVAHTADDQVEEILLRLIRGSGRRGVSGMQMRRGKVIRPLLETTKKQILDYLKVQNISFCHDSSNDDMRFLRNKIRRELLPFLEQKIDRGVRKALLKTAGNLAEDEACLDQLTDEAWHQVVCPVPEAGNTVTILQLDRQAFSLLHPALQRRVVERLLWQIGSRAHHEHILAVVKAAVQGRTGSELHLSRGLRVGIRRDRIEFVYPRGRHPWRGRLYE